MKKTHKDDAALRLATVPCTYGDPARNGDFVLCLHKPSRSSSDVKICAGLVWKGKVYTGRGKTGANILTLTGPWINKLSAIMVISEELIPSDEYNAIMANINAQGVVRIGCYLEEQ